MTTPNFEVRVAIPEDADAIAQIHHDSWLATYPNEAAGILLEDIQSYVGDIQTRRDRWRKSLGEGDLEKVRVFVVERDGKIIGFCSVAKEDEQNKVNAVYLDPSAMRQGAGSAVLQAGLEWLGDEKSVYLEAVAYNAPAIAFYKRFGFYEDGEDKPHQVGNGKAMPSIRMTRDTKL